MRIALALEQSNVLMLSLDLYLQIADVLLHFDLLFLCKCAHLCVGGGGLVVEYMLRDSIWKRYREF